MTQKPIYVWNDVKHKSDGHFIAYTLVEYKFHIIFFQQIVIH